jgi:Flp pilus assembly protein TadG
LLSVNSQNPNARACPERKWRGQAIVEFALAIPFIFMLIFGVIEFGRLMFSYSLVVTAAREAARYGSAVENYQDCAGIQDAAVRVGGMTGVQAGNVLINYDDGFGGGVRSCPPGVLPLGSRVIVQVHDVTYTPLVPMVNLPAMSLQSEARRTILIGLELR